MLHLFSEGADFCRAEIRFFIFEFAFRWAVRIFFLGHGFGGGTKSVFLELNPAKQGRSNGFILAHFSGAGLLRGKRTCAGKNHDRSWEGAANCSRQAQGEVIGLHGAAMVAARQQVLKHRGPRKGFLIDTIHHEKL